eukprot:scaffold5494_cov28-Tisochrysis_lutea.AAC.3
MESNKKLHTFSTVLNYGQYSASGSKRVRPKPLLAKICTQNPAALWGGYHARLLEHGKRPQTMQCGTPCKSPSHTQLMPQQRLWSLENVRIPRRPEKCERWERLTCHAFFQETSSMRKR